MSLLRLPYELLSIICEHLDLRDIYSLSFSCKRFQFLLYEPNITKLLLEVSEKKPNLGIGLSG
jgi:hypothetical protein